MLWMAFRPSPLVMAALLLVRQDQQDEDHEGLGCATNGVPKFSRPVNREGLDAGWLFLLPGVASSASTRCRSGEGFPG
jgi:hypothetical protein